MEAPGQLLGHYRIVAKLGEGGMGEVWRASDTRLNREVAIKVLPAGVAGDPERLARFEREAKTLAALNHPRIAQIYGLEQGALVMELVEGEPLRGPLPLARAVEYAGQILDALDAAHQKGIVHRDLKPANILVTKQGIKLLDFGLAKLEETPATESDETLSRALTRQGQIVGTLQYMSPEQLNGKEVDARSDLFSFGCVLYEMLSGKRAFDGQSAASVIAAVLEREPEPLQAAPPLERVIRRALAKDPEQRFQTARDLKASLSWAMENAPPMAATPRDRAWLPWALSAAAAIAATTLATSYLQHRAPERHVVRVTTGMSDMFSVPRFALSHDGRYMAYRSVANILALRSMQTEAVQTFPDIHNPSSFAWSPDDRSLLVSAANNRIVRLDPASGAISDLGTPALPVNSLAWMPDGTILVGGTFSGILKIEPGGKQQPLIRAAAGHFYSVAAAVDRNRFLYRTRGPAGSNQVFLASLDGKTDIPLALGAEGHVEYSQGNLLYVQNGTLLARSLAGNGRLGEPMPIATGVAPENAGVLDDPFTASQESTVVYKQGGATSEQLELFDRDGKSTVLPPGRGQFNNPRFSPDGRWLAYDAVSGNDRDVWIYNLALQQATRFTLGGSNSDPVWSPDGSQLAFTRATGTAWEIVARPSNGARGETMIANGPQPKYGREWTAAGQFVYDELGTSGTWSVWKTGSAGGSAPVEYVPSNGFNNVSPHVSPDGKWLAYDSDQSGEEQVYLEAFPVRGGKWQVSTAGGQQPRWAGDGRSLYFLSLDNQLMQAQLTFAAVGPAVTHLSPLFAVPPAKVMAGNPLDVTRDGSRFVLNVELPGATDSWTVLLNWQAALGGKK